jgi:hypothetical protein
MTAHCDDGDYVVECVSDGTNQVTCQCSRPDAETQTVTVESNPPDTCQIAADVCEMEPFR